MKPILFLYYPKCDTCRKAEKWLIANNVEIVRRDIATDNPTKAELGEWLAKSGLTINRFFNTSGKIYKENNLKEKVAEASKDELLTILSSNGMVVKRPIIVSDNFVLVGFSEKDWQEKLNR